MTEKTLPHIRRAHLPAIDRGREMKWMAHHRSEYRGQWVALEGSRLIAHGRDPVMLVTQARLEGVERPLVVRVREEYLACTGGWL